MDILKNLAEVFNNFQGYVGLDSVWSIILMVLDISIVAFIVYKVIVLVRETRAWQLIRGIIFILIAAEITNIIGLQTIAGLFKYTISIIAFAFVVIFQPELRRGLERIGRSKFINLFSWEEESSKVQTIAAIEEVVKATTSMASTYTGALIVIERDTKLGEITNTGVEIGAAVTSELIVNLFTPKTPLHDGAIIIRDGKILAAACFLPLTDNPYLSKELGTRHRAALGISEISDAVAIVISEETGKISYALNGSLTRGLNSDKLRQVLNKTLIPNEKETKKINLRRGKQSEKKTAE